MLIEILQVVGLIAANFLVTWHLMSCFAAMWRGEEMGELGESKTYLFFSGLFMIVLLVVAFGWIAIPFLYRKEYRAQWKGLSSLSPRNKLKAMQMSYRLRRVNKQDWSLYPRPTCTRIMIEKPPSFFYLRTTDYPDDIYWIWLLAQPNMNGHTWTRSGHDLKYHIEFTGTKSK